MTNRSGVLSLRKIRTLLLTPPMTQLNTPYPATAYLTGFLKATGKDVVQADPALLLILRLFSRDSLKKVGEELNRLKACGQLEETDSLKNFLESFSHYLETIEPVISFLQGKDPSLAYRIQTRAFLPEGPRFVAAEQASAAGAVDSPDGLEWAFGRLGLSDRAKYLATLYLDDLADVLQQGIDPRFGLSRYGEKLAASQASFDPLRIALQSPLTLIDQMLLEITDELMLKFRPDFVGISAPFPGNVYGAFRIAHRIKATAPQVPVALGGGYVNTELRELKDPRVFDAFDFITLDDGERPILTIIETLEGARTKSDWVRTFYREDGRVVFQNQSMLHDIPHRETAPPSYEGLPLGDYLQLFELLNPMHRIWSDGRWNKLTLAHGCYWRKCNFCDVTLDYIGRYDPASVDLLIDRIEKMIAATGTRGFHFVDEAAPPALLKALALRILERGLVITWWGNIRFEKTFDQELTELLARSGCIAVSGGLEVASDRLLKLMNKGVSVEQVARVTHAFTQSGILVHAYLMYGVPSQTVQETVDALERVRQLFVNGCIQSGFWHRFSVTAHSPIGKNPDAFGLKLHRPSGVSFAVNDLPFEDTTGVDHDALGEGLRRALYNYMHGLGFDEDVSNWFEVAPKDGSAVTSKKERGVRRQRRASIPAATVDPRLIEKALRAST
jgi:hypothetical protein